jgi:hypothetical protein
MSLPADLIRNTVIMAGLVLTTGPVLAFSGNGVLDDPFPYVSINQDIRDALGEFATEHGLVLDMSDNVTGRFRGRVSVSDGRQLLDRAAHAGRAVWYVDGKRIVLRSASELMTRRFDVSHLGEAERKELLQTLQLDGSAAALAYDERTHDIVVRGLPELADRVSRAIKPPPSRRGTSVAIHRFSTR